MQCILHPSVWMIFGRSAESSKIDPDKQITFFLKTLCLSPGFFSALLLEAGGMQEAAGV